ncbi:hypothetical protein GBA52_005978 [Prunus armeniaca]|nr:hypothetical protein GBA52_005978 [Prunus armeniaca]
MGPAGPKEGRPLRTRLVAGVQDTLKWRSPRSRICRYKCTWIHIAYSADLPEKGGGCGVCLETAKRKRKRAACL